MLNQETKRRIDSARDILVGKVPDPKAQVEQITTAMIYKFMDDMDKEAQELGGKARFFTNGYEKYSWTIIMDPKLGGHERLNLYAEAVIKMAENPHIPQLFRDIFKDAFLPYRSPETLSLFLKEINGFKYVHSEDLGDAFEYLLSILGSQGDAGQFRTPRHIIDFIVDVVDTKKDESILDPACGTAGFLISAFKHIQRQHKDKPLNPEDKKRMMNHIVGYDISPDMVKLSKVNMYLHGFPTPHIFEYDTLSSEEKWDETYDVIMANPPFMTPKGGIKPHKRFSVQANRAEVLFVNYIMEHLNINGRAGIIVPEGIIFQSGNAYKQLRKLLVDENYLWAVVSLPAGVFQPYSGVKTSILLLDRQIAKQSESILFVKIDNDGFDLGAQRREINKNDLPIALALIDSYKRNIVAQNTPKTNDLETLTKNTISIFVPKSKIRNLGDYYLTGDRYKEINEYKNQKWPMTELSEICDIESGSRQKGGALNKGVPSIGGEQISEDGNIRFNKMKYISEDHFKNMKSGILKKGDVLIVKDGATTGKTGFYFGNNSFEKAAINEHVFILRSKGNILSQFLYYIVKSQVFQTNLKPYIKGIIGGISLEIKKIKIPLPPLEFQRKILEEINRYQQIINGARTLVENWESDIDIDPMWNIVNLSDICNDFKNGLNFSRDQVGRGTKFINIKDVYSDDYIKVEDLGKVQITSSEISQSKVNANDLIFVRSSVKYEGVGYVSLMPSYDENVVFCGFTIKCSPDISKVLPQYLLWLLRSRRMRTTIIGLSNRANITNISQSSLKQLKIPLPDLSTQERIVKNIEEEQKIVQANKKMIEIYGKKITYILNKI